MAVITFTDFKTGLGGLVSVIGSAGATNTLWLSRFHGTNASRTFAIQGTRLGDGTIPLSAPMGCYFAHLASVSGTTLSLSAPIAFRVTNGSISLFEKVVVGIREHILSLALPGIATDPAKHIVCKMGAKLQELLRTGNQCVYYIPVSESFSGADNAYLTVALSVNVIFITKTGHSLSEGLSEILLAREDANLSFAASPLVDVPEVYSIDCKPGVVTDPGQWSQGFDVSVLQFIAYSEQIDGIL